MSAAESPSSQRRDEHTVEPRVSALELFFDLVLVFAITQVTGLLSDDPTWFDLLGGIALLAALATFETVREQDQRRKLRGR